MLFKSLTSLAGPKVGATQMNAKIQGISGSSEWILSSPAPSLAIFQHRCKVRMSKE
ncbi:hypothetical protein DFA_06352 [Cavenderia fasciculata]|uniref:Uncharacterized protein n=1 Tax=Cavenderia fasciculata TaxID=261658 RepID=F4PKT1_CACFS|nr:uncharacterized protein DFA_06352 [Cavenderia fasciculata]EGG24205.1 hypothetical protein DFA_06352 [Cavenderia fasciculata]|eukprot:XP_004362056.1 hypothetical protein DFA_06352 [Cavenderia fasciculata]